VCRIAEACAALGAQTQKSIGKLALCYKAVLGFVLRRMKKAFAIS
jgi:hypothetical protein